MASHSKKSTGYNGEKGLMMKDGEYAWLTESKNYYCRREPDFDNWTGIAYYDAKTLERIPLAKGKCPSCKQIIESQHCGDFVPCGCGNSFVDTDRWAPERHRYGGQVIPI